MKLSRIFAGSLCLLSISTTSSALPQFINEFHYDNSGADRFESVEIAGEAGSLLDGWSLDFYNGSNGQIYMSWALSGVIDDEGLGYGALAFSGSSGLQNGPNDGIALINNLGDLVQFISYEGALIGMEGVATGMLSEDIGFSEDGSTPLGYSLQLVGEGTDSEAFSWVNSESSFGRLNEGQTYQFNNVGIVQSNPITQSVSEPQSLAMMSLALLGLLGRRKIFNNAA